MDQHLLSNYSSYGVDLQDPYPLLSEDVDGLAFQDVDMSDSCHAIPSAQVTTQVLNHRQTNSNEQFATIEFRDISTGSSAGSFVCSNQVLVNDSHLQVHSVSTQTPN